MKRECLMITLFVAMAMSAVADGNTYLNFKAVNGPATIILNGTNDYNLRLQYSTDNCATWNSYTFGNTINLASGSRVYLKATDNNTSFENYSFSMTGTVEGDGNIMSLLDSSMQLDSVPICCFFSLFWCCTSLTQAPVLPATTLADSCYSNMFNGCTSLTQAPALPAMTLTKNCYSNMFNGCSSLTQAPALPATTLTKNCYSNMFNRCSSLTQAPALPATTLADSCYWNMFNGCTSLTQAPALPATIMAENCYWNMFNGCTSLTQAPALPAMSLAKNCYSYMFYGCTSLTQAPALPAMTLADYCYEYMFAGCTSLMKTPMLPATAIDTGCYCGMFYSCTLLSSLPELPATELISYCYAQMFENCKKLKINKQRPGTPWMITATTEDKNLLTWMFLGTSGTMDDTPELNVTYYVEIDTQYVDTASADVYFYCLETYGSVTVDEYELVLYKIGGNDTVDIKFRNDTTFDMQRAPRVIEIVDSVSGTTTTVTISINQYATGVEEINIHLENLAPKSSYVLQLSTLDIEDEALETQSCVLVTFTPSAVEDVQEEVAFFPTEETDVYTIEGRYVGKYNLDLPPGIYLMREKGKWHKFGKSR